MCVTVLVLDAPGQSSFSFEVLRRLQCSDADGSVSDTIGWLRVPGTT